MVNTEFYNDFFKLFQLGADTGGETQPGDRAAAPAEALPIPVPTHQAGGTTGTPGKWQLGGWAAQGATGFRVCSHSWWGQGAETSCSSPIQFCSRLRSQLCPVQARGCHGHPSNGPCALRCLLFLSAWYSPCQAWHGQHTSRVPWALRQAQNILPEQHLTLQGSLCPQQGPLAAARCPKQPGSVRSSRSPGCAPGWQQPQPCPCLLPVPAGAAQPQPESLSHPQAGLDPGEAQLGTWSGTGQCHTLSRQDLAVGLLGTALAGGTSTGQLWGRLCR